jgi:hypothetical protein
MPDKVKPAKAAEKKEEPKKAEGAEKAEDKEKEGKEKGEEGKEKGEKGEEGEKKEGEEGKDGEGEKEIGKDGKDENGKCVGEDTCAGDAIATKFEAPNDVLVAAKKKLDDGVKEGVKNVMTTLGNPLKCAKLITAEIPNVIPNMIDKIGKSISGAFNDINLSITKTFENAGNVDIKGYPDLFGPFEVAWAMGMSKIQGVINGIALGVDAEKILSDPNLTAKILFDKLVLRSNLYKMALDDAEIRGIFKDWMAQYVDTLLNALKIAQPEIDRINNEVKTIIEGMGDNIGTSLGHAITNIIASALSALPVVGGVVSAIKSADQLGQEIINACKPPIAKGAGILMPPINEFNKQKSKLECEINKLKSKIEPPIKRLEEKMASVTAKIDSKMANVTAKLDSKMASATAKLDSKMASATEQKGGGGGGQNKIKIQRTTRRIKQMLMRFQGKKPSKPNYTRRLHKARRG